MSCMAAASVLVLLAAYTLREPGLLPSHTTLTSNKPPATPASLLSINAPWRFRIVSTERSCFLIGCNPVKSYRPICVKITPFARKLYGNETRNGGKCIEYLARLNAFLRDTN